MWLSPSIPPLTYLGTAADGLAAQPPSQVCLLRVGELTAYGVHVPLSQ